MSETLTLAQVLAGEPRLTPSGDAETQIVVFNEPQPNDPLGTMPLADGFRLEKAWLILAARDAEIPPGDCPAEFASFGDGGGKTFSAQKGAQFVAKVLRAETGPLGVLWSGLSRFGGARGDMWLAGALTETTFVGRLFDGAPGPGTCVRIGCIDISDVGLEYLATRPSPRGSLAPGKTAGPPRDEAPRESAPGAPDPAAIVPLSLPRSGAAWIELDAKITLGKSVLLRWN